MAENNAVSEKTEHCTISVNTNLKQFAKEQNLNLSAIMRLNLDFLRELKGKNMNEYRILKDLKIVQNPPKCLQNGADKTIEQEIIVDKQYVSENTISHRRAVIETVFNIIVEVLMRFWHMKEGYVDYLDGHGNVIRREYTPEKMTEMLNSLEQKSKELTAKQEELERLQKEQQNSKDTIRSYYIYEVAEKYQTEIVEYLERKMKARTLQNKMFYLTNPKYSNIISTEEIYNYRKINGKDMPAVQKHAYKSFFKFLKIRKNREFFNNEKIDRWLEVLDDSPIRKGAEQPRQDRQKNIPTDEVLRAFFNSLPVYYRRLALLDFYTGARFITLVDFLQMENKTVILNEKYPDLLIVDGSDLHTTHKGMRYLFFPIECKDYVLKQLQYPAKKLKETRPAKATDEWQIRKNEDSRTYQMYRRKGNAVGLKIGANSFRKFYDNIMYHQLNGDKTLVNLMNGRSENNVSVMDAYYVEHLDEMCELASKYLKIATKICEWR